MADRGEKWKDWAPQYIADLIQDFGFKDWQAAAFVGNFAAESDYFRDIIEDGAIAKGWAGGTGHAQWTGSRRKTFEAWLRKKGWDGKPDGTWGPNTYEGNYSYLARELKGWEKSQNHSNVVNLVKGARNLENATWRVAKYYERPAKINLDTRIARAKEALELYRANPPRPTVWEKEMTTTKPADPAAIPWFKSPVFTGAVTGFVGSVIATIQLYKPGVSITQQLDTLLPPVIAAAGTLFAAINRATATAQPLTGTQAGADRAIARKEAEVETEAVPPVVVPVALRERSLEEVVDELPDVLDLLLRIGAAITPVAGVLNELRKVAKDGGKDESNGKS